MELDAAIVADDKCRVKKLNGIAEKLTGWKEAEAFHQPLSQVFDICELASRKKIVNVVEQVLKRETEKLLLRSRDGSQHVVLGKISPLREGGKISGISLSFRDVSERERMEQSLRRRHEEMHAINRLTDFLIESDSAGEFCSRVLDSLQHLLGTEHVSVLTFDHNRMLQFRAWRGFSENFRERTEWIFPWEADADNPQPILIDDIDDSALHAALRRLVNSEGVRALSFFPLQSRKNLLGAVLIAYRKPHSFNSLEVRLVQTLSGQMAVAIERERAVTLQKSFENKYLLLVDKVKEIIFQTDENGCWTFLSPAWEEVTGFSQEKSLGTHFLDYVHPADRQKHLQKFLRVLKGGEESEKSEIRYSTLDGKYRLGEISLAALCDEEGKVSGLMGALCDITEAREAQEKIRQLAYHDKLTGLPNRPFLIERIEALTQREKPRGIDFCLLFLDLDYFNGVNDSLGHAAGDELLKVVAERLKSCVRQEDWVFRLGDDEFVVLAAHPAGGNVEDASRAAAMVAEKIRLVLANPILLGEDEVLTTPSIGISLYPWDSDNAGDLLKYADVALHHAKLQGRNNYQFYSEHMTSATLERLALQKDLRKALDRGELEIHYQPQVDIEQGGVVGMEALIRWKHPHLGWIAPSKFIPIAEETGLILEIGEWLLKTVCGQMKVWQLAGLLSPSQYIAINVSPRQFKQVDFARLVEGILAESALDGHHLELEMTESMLMHNTESTLAMLDRLKLLGVKLSIDDFGTGYSSLSYLKRFPLDVLKIDQSFVRDITVDPNDAAIVTAIIAMAKSLKLKVIAEGVETPDQLSYLKEQGCHGFQGYYFSKPVPKEGMAELFRATG